MTILLRWFGLSALLVVLIQSSDCLAQWTELQSGTTSTLHGIWFDDDLTGYCVGGGDMWGWPVDSGLVLRTDNAGTTWYPVLQLPDIAINEVVAFNDTIICSARRISATVSLTSFDGGNTWAEDTLPYAMFGMTEDQGIVRYMDWSFGGLHEIRNGVHNVWYLGAPMAYHVVGDSYTVLVELPGEQIFVFFSDHLDGGWIQRPVDLPTAVFAGHPPAVYRNADTILVRNTDMGYTLVSLDEGVTWTPEYDGASSESVFHSASDIHGLEMSGSIRHSGDLGASWTLQYTGTSKLLGIHFIDRLTGFVCGEHGVILKTGNGGSPVGMPELENATSLVAFPNPADNEVSIVIPANWNVSSIELLDAQGVLVRRFALDERRFNLADVASGVMTLLVTHDRLVSAVRLVKH